MRFIDDDVAKKIVEKSFTFPNYLRHAYTQFTPIKQFEKATVRLHPKDLDYDLSIK